MNSVCTGLPGDLCQTAQVADEDARRAAVKAALAYVRPEMTLGLGSGRAVFALAQALGGFDYAGSITTVCGSPETERRASEAGLTVRGLDDVTRVDLVIDGADEVDPDLALIKGGGAALLREKLLIRAADQVVIICEAHKLVQRLGDTRRLPVEVVPYGWTWTRERVLRLTSSAELRRHEDGSPVLTAESDYLLDVAVADGDIAEFAHALTAALGVVEHGLFLGDADVVLVGNEDGTVDQRLRST